MKKILLMGALVMSALTIQAQTADEIIDKYVAARGGVDKLKGVKSVRMETTTSLMGNDIKTVSSIVAGKGMRSDATVMGQTMSQGYDGTKGWMINPMMGSTDPQEIPSEMSSTLADQLDLTGPMVDYKTKGNKVEMLGKEAVDGKDTYKVQVTRPNGTVITHYINATTYLDQKVATKTKVNGQDVEGEAFFDDYRAVEGIKFPFVTEMTNPQFGRMKIKFEKVEVNPTIDEALFKMPAKK
jgi:outer membrane lipoprotein-sorting protein